MSNRELLREGLEKFGITTNDKILNDFSIYREILVEWKMKEKFI